MTKFFKKSKKSFFGIIWAMFAQIWRKKNFPGKELGQLLNIPIIYHGAKTLKKVTTHS